MVRVVDYIMDRLSQEGIRHIFYVPGGQAVYLTDAIRRAESIEGISTHHEQAAAMAALAYGQYNNHLGACVVTTGCAGTNTMTGVLHAWQDSIPCIFVSGQQHLNQTIYYSGLPVRQIGMQETDIVRIVSPITKYAAIIEKPEDIAVHLDKALYEAMHGRKGPVWIDVPLNVQNAMIDEAKLMRWNEGDCDKYDIDEKDILDIIESIKNAKRPVVVAGQAVRSAEAIDELRKFVDTNRIPVLFNRSSIDILEYSHPMNMGVVSPISANRYANFIVQNADFILNLGCRLSIDMTGPEQDTFAREAKIIAVDINPIEHQKKGVKIDKVILADLKDVLCKLNQKAIDVNCDTWVELCNHWKEVFPDYDETARDRNGIDIKLFLDRLSKTMPPNSTVLSDAGFTGAIVPANCHVEKNERMIHSYAQGEMGFVLPGAFGPACLSEAPVLAITGDGSLMMNLQELQTLVRNQFNVKLIVNNNNGYSGVRHGQKAHFRGKSIGTDPTNGVDFPDLSKLATAFGINYIRIETTEEIDVSLKRIFEDSKPCICEVMGDPEQFDLHNALVMYDKRKFGFRPIEDQSPFIDRDLFFKEMIVKPMETSYGKPV